MSEIKEPALNSLKVLIGFECQNNSKSSKLLSKSALPESQDFSIHNCNFSKHCY
jgi:hypothetical protein